MDNSFDRLKQALADRYLLDRELGAGGMATVFLAVSRDGERFLMTRLPVERPRPRIAVVLNWFDELRAKVPR